MFSIAFAAVVLFNRSITVEAGPGAAPNVIALLKETTGLKVAADSTLGKCVLYVNVRDVRESDLKSTLARAAHARWVDQNGTEILVRDRELVKELEAEFKGKLVAQIEAEQKRMRSEEKPWSDDQIQAIIRHVADSARRRKEGDNRSQDPPTDNPMARFGRELFCAMDARVLANFALSAPNQWSSMVSSGPRAMPRIDPKVWQDFKVRLKQTDDRYSAVYPDGNGPGGRAGMEADFNPRSEVTSYELRTSSYNDQATLNVQVSCADGRSYQWYTIGLGAIDRGSDRIASAIGTNPLTVSSDTVEALKAFRSGDCRYWASTAFCECLVADPTETQLALVHDPVARDPFDYDAKDVLRVFAKAAPHGLVAALPDQCIDSFEPWLDKTTLSVSSVLGALTKNGMVWDIDGSTWIMTPNNVVRAEQKSIDRRDLKALVESVESQGVLRSSIKFESTLMDTDWSPVIRRYISPFVRNEIVSIMFDPIFPKTDFSATLRRDVVDQANRGQTVVVQGLTDQQKRLIEKRCDSGEFRVSRDKPRISDDVDSRLQVILPNWKSLPATVEVSGNNETWLESVAPSLPGREAHQVWSVEQANMMRSSYGDKSWQNELGADKGARFRVVTLGKTVAKVGFPGGFYVKLNSWRVVSAKDPFVDKIPDSFLSLLKKKPFS